MKRYRCATANTMAPATHLRQHPGDANSKDAVRVPTYDPIVVGFGISGGWAAKELTERGLRVLLLERGKNIEHIKDYSNATRAPWQYPRRGRRTQELIRRRPV